MSWFLFVVFITAQGGVSNSIPVAFQTERACRDAAAVIQADFAKSRIDGAGTITSCVQR